MTPVNLGHLAWRKSSFSSGRTWPRATPGTRTDRP